MKPGTYKELYVLIPTTLTLIELKVFKLWSFIKFYFDVFALKKLNKLKKIFSKSNILQNIIILVGHVDNICIHIFAKLQLKILYTF